MRGELREAVDFVGAAETPLPMLTRWPEPGAEVTDQQKLHLHGSRYIGLRTRYYDDWLRDAATSGVRQLVLLGAGLDTRAYRLDWPAGVRLFGIDQLGVLAFKEKALAERTAKSTCELVPVAVARHALRHGAAQRQLAAESRLESAGLYADALGLGQGGQLGEGRHVHAADLGTDGAAGREE